MNIASIYVKSVEQLEKKVIPLFQYANKDEYPEIIRNDIYRIREQISELPGNIKPKNVNFD